MTDEALKAVERANELLDEVERLREKWKRSRELIESAKQIVLPQMVISPL